ncbi:MAG: sigma-70 family RNA polymerase sigma factor [Phycisphaeraceae bacterium]|nr:sigma-70 family RNA polymerase sigma factor [Phycisphaeraceae bacterium]MCW5761961.1 sigma-70 family RNA polymerase sigma factor [Phycisphaeraceae bacterium]
MLDQAFAIGEERLAEKPSDLIERARRDPAAFGELYREHYVAIAQYIVRRVGDVHLAEDLAAETFIDAWRGMLRYRNEGIAFRHWLLRIATNRVNRWARRKRREHVVACVPEVVVEAGTGAGREVVEVLLTLRSEHQAVLCLHHVEGLSVESVALVLGVSVGTVKSRLHRARRAMRKALEIKEVDS